MTTTPRTAPRTTEWSRRLRIAAWSGAAILALLPVVADRFLPEMRWTVSDFVFWDVLLVLGLAAVETALRLSDHIAYRIALTLGAGAALAMVLIQGAVGLVGSENDLFNLIFLLPLLVGATGGFIAQFEADGMSRMLWVMAVLQTITIAIGLAVTRDLDALLVGLWVLAWALAAWLFGLAAKADGADREPV